MSFTFETFVKESTSLTKAILDSEAPIFLLSCDITSISKDHASYDVSFLFIKNF
jgi:hypothetical protein